MNLKSSFQLIITTLTIIMIFGCNGEDGLSGADGDDGTSYIAITWVSGPLYYDDDNPATPSTFWNGIYYESNPGTYYYAYEAWDGSVWVGYYTITINEGEPGEEGEKGDIFWQDGADGEDGEDGEDICFELSCLSIGSSLYAWDCPSSQTTSKMEIEMNKLKNAGIKTENSTPSFLGGSKNLKSLFYLYSNTEMVKESGTKGIYQFEHYYKQVK